MKCIPLHRLEDAVRIGVGLSPVFSVFLVDDQITSSPHISGPTGDTRLVPDPAAAVPLAASPGWALAPLDQVDQEGEAFPACARTFARRMLKRLASLGLELRGSYELEFFLGRRTLGGPEGEPDPVPVHTGPAYSAIVRADVEPFATALIRALEQQGTGVMQFHPEYSTGQLEVSIPHRAGIAIADTSLVVRHTVLAVAQSQGPSGLVRAGRVRRARGQRGPHPPEPLGPARTQPVPRRSRARGHDPQGGGVHCRRARLDAVPDGHHGPLGRQLSAVAVAPLERIVGVLGGDREAALRFVTGMVGSRAEAANLEINAMGDVLFEAFLATGRGEQAAFEVMDPAPVVRAHRWQY